MILSRTRAVSCVPAGDMKHQKTVAGTVVSSCTPARNRRFFPARILQRPCETLLIFSAHVWFEYDDESFNHVPEPLHSVGAQDGFRFWARVSTSAFHSCGKRLFCDQPRKAIFTRVGKTKKIGSKPNIVCVRYAEVLCDKKTASIQYFENGRCLFTTIPLKSELTKISQRV